MSVLFASIKCQNLRPHHRVCVLCVCVCVSVSVSVRVPVCVSACACVCARASVCIQACVLIIWVIISERQIGNASFFFVCWIGCLLPLLALPIFKRQLPYPQ